MFQQLEITVVDMAKELVEASQACAADSHRDDFGLVQDTLASWVYCHRVKHPNESSNSKLICSHEDIERCAGRDDVVACQQSVVQSARPVMSSAQDRR